MPNVLECAYKDHDKYIFTINRTSAPDSSKVLANYLSQLLIGGVDGWRGQD